VSVVTEVQKFARAKPTQTQTGNLTRLQVSRQNEICQIFGVTLGFFFFSFLQIDKTRQQFHQGGSTSTATPQE
jgi:hypothetical protein